MFGRNFIFLTIIIILQSVKCIENESHGGTTDLDRCFEVISNAVNAAGDVSNCHESFSDIFNDFSMVLITENPQRIK